MKKHRVFFSFTGNERTRHSCLVHVAIIGNTVRIGVARRNVKDRHVCCSGTPTLALQFKHEIVALISTRSQMIDTKLYSAAVAPSGLQKQYSSSQNALNRSGLRNYTKAPSTITLR